MSNVKGSQDGSVHKKSVHDGAALNEASLNGDALNEDPPQKPTGEGKTRLGFVLVSLFSSSASLLLLPLYVTYLDAAQYGIWALVWLVANLAGALSNLKLDHAMRVLYFDNSRYFDNARHFDNRTDEKAREGLITTLLSASFMVCLLSLLVFMALGFAFFERLFTSSELTFFPLGLMALVSVVISHATSAFYALLQNQKSLKQFARLKLSLSGMSLTAQVLILLFSDLGILGLVSAALATSLINLLWVLSLCRRQLSFRFSLSLLKQALVFTAPLTLFGFLFLAEGKVDRILIENLLSLSDVGIYALLGTVGSVLFLFYNAMDSGFRADLYGCLAQPDEDKTLSRLFSFYQLPGLVVMSALLALACLVPLLPVAQSYGELSQYLVVFVIALTPLPLLRWQGLVLLYEKKSTKLVLLTAVKLCLHLLLLVVVLPVMGLWGAIAALFLSNLLNVLIYHYLTSKALRHVILLKPLIPLYLGLLSVAALILLLMQQATSNFFVVILGLVQLIVFAVVSIFFSQAKGRSLKLFNTEQSIRQQFTGGFDGQK